MKKSLITRFDVRPAERNMLTVLELIFVFSLVGLFLAVQNQSGERLTEGTVVVSDTVSVVCESLAYLSTVGLLVVLRRSLRRVGQKDGLAGCVRLLSVAIVSDIVYVVVGKLLLLHFGTEAFPVVLDFVATVAFALFAVLAAGVLSRLNFHAIRPLGRYIRRACVALLSSIGLFGCLLLMGIFDQPDGIMDVLLASSLAACCVAFVLLSRMLKFHEAEQPTQAGENA